MNKVILSIFLLLAAGCSYLDEPGKLLKDQHYVAYQEKLSALESSYLKNEMTYAEYLEKKKEIDDMYGKEVKDRAAAIEGQE